MTLRELARQPRLAVGGAADARDPDQPALIAAAADGQEIVDDACAKKAVAELTRD